jgi:hypothetical protein
MTCLVVRAVSGTDQVGYTLCLAKIEHLYGSVRVISLLKVYRFANVTYGPFDLCYSVSRPGHRGRSTKCLMTRKGR